MPKSIRSRRICFWTESIQLYDDAQDHDNDDDDDGVDDDDEEDDDDTRPILARFGVGTSQNVDFHKNFKVRFDRRFTYFCEMDMASSGLSLASLWALPLLLPNSPLLSEQGNCRSNRTSGVL